MRAQASGRALAELTVHGGFQTLDLARFGYSRVEKDEPYPETGII